MIPRLRGLTPSFAKTLLRALGCTVGQLTRAASKTVPKGLVIGTNPGASTVAAGQAAITVSSGRHAKKQAQALGAKCAARAAVEGGCGSRASLAHARLQIDFAGVVRES